ncbi:unnamed protein product [Nesidiocoris tenuis]|uniref:Uncharacterized protein n=1 Tax=Nesidiocoris tenuis TaxID=355587 RepID=A0A6H5H8V4_9HEMI|nr:unnamed protein product [Nesidiocoris tenuis]
MNRPNGDFSDGDDISLDGELARQMFDESAALRDPDTENLRLQAAKTSEEVFSRYIEELKQQMESSFDKISTKLSDLDRKYNELTQQVHSRPGDQTCVQNSSLNQNFDQNLQNLESMQVVAPMEVDKSLNDAPINVSQPEPSTAPPRNSNLFLRPYEQAQTSSLRDEQYRTRKIDAVKFRPLDQKLESEEQFKYWRRSIVGQIETQECAFLIDPSEKIPPAFSNNDPDAIFAIAGPSDLPDTENVWVTLGGEEERLISETNLLRETGETEDIVAYSDSSLGTSAVNGRSTTGYSVKLFGDLVSWKSKKQAHVALSTNEAEYIAMSEACFTFKVQDPNPPKKSGSKLQINFTTAVFTPNFKVNISFVMVIGCFFGYRLFYYERYRMFRTIHALKGRSRPPQQRNHNALLRIL